MDKSKTANNIQFLSYWLNLCCILRYDTNVRWFASVVQNTAEALKQRSRSVVTSNRTAYFLCIKSLTNEIFITKTHNCRFFSCLLEKEFGVVGFGKQIGYINFSALFILSSIKEYSCQISLSSCFFFYVR
jgi:hypothetical protein